LDEVLRIVKKKKKTHYIKVETWWQWTGGKRMGNYCLIGNRISVFFCLVLVLFVCFGGTEA
jgi:hypothetical protein